ncbi:agmatinase [Candidatus Micrarchaeota archaeon CG11_big_fil_rev_8_21_14_0_20_47_5]|nr:MAG: agmatinase [Candidatus Micrarchaeota archaeon CG1_02_47_40]PIN83721.1 MAG: agmatinase [Candidatus Micrarchaeota archaeon CG11_big_fil_rev_8_21_14_0_20_47_5]
MKEFECIPFTFLGMKNNLKNAKTVIVQAPYDGTVFYKDGQRHGPREIIDASRHMELYDAEFGCDVCESAPVYTMDELVLSKESPKKAVERVGEVVDEVLKERKFPLVLGGEHSVSAGAVSACAKKFKKNFSVLQIDAHGDLRDAYEGTKYSHACAMRRAREACGNIVQAGVRSMSGEEAEWIKKERIEKYIFGSEFEESEVLERIENENVYVTFDLDGFDPSIMPAVGTPEPGGISWKQATSLLRKVFERKNVIGADVVELCPVIGDTASAFLAAKLCYKMIGWKFLL